MKSLDNMIVDAKQKSNESQIDIGNLLLVQAIRDLTAAIEVMKRGR